MANPKHMNILRIGVEAWNSWREENPDIRPDLRSASLSGAPLSGFNLTGADLTGANLTRADLKGAILSRALLSGTILTRTDLSDTIGLDQHQIRRIHFDPSFPPKLPIGLELPGIEDFKDEIAEILRKGVDAWNSWREEKPFFIPYLMDADLTGANLTGADLRFIILTATTLTGADLTDAIHLKRFQIQTIRFDPDHPPKLPEGLELPIIEDAGEEDAESLDAEPIEGGKRAFGGGFGKGSPHLRAHPKDRIILSGQLSTPTVRFRRETSERELEDLRDLLARCVPGNTNPDKNENVLRVPMEQESLDLLQSIVKTVIELHKAPSYPEGLVDALRGLGVALRFFKISADWAPLPKPLKDKIGSAVTAYDGFLTVLGLI